MGWTFPRASSLGGDFNFDYSVDFTEEEHRRPIRRMRAEWTASGACTSGSTALPKGASRSDRDKGEGGAWKGFGMGAHSISPPTRTGRFIDYSRIAGDQASD
jgi:hypothetical protein